MAIPNVARALEFQDSRKAAHLSRVCDHNKRGLEAGKKRVPGRLADLYRGWGSPIPEALR